MAEWSQLPRELLDLIAKHLQTEMDVLRFRSVCSSWRSVVTNPLRTPSRFPILPNEGISDTLSWGFYLSKRTIFRIGLTQQLHPQTPSPSSSSSSSSADGWLVKIEQDVPHRTHLLNPLSRSQFKPLPDTFPRSLDLLRYRVSELGHEYILQYINYRPFANSISDAGNLYMEKVALSSRPCSGSTTDAHVLLTIHVSGKLAMFKFRDRKWTVIDDLPSPYDDVILFHGQFYAVDNTGRTVLVNVDSSPVVTLVAHSVFGGDKKVLVESCGDLLLIDTYLSVGPEDDLGSDEGFEFFEEFDCVMSERTVRFRVFRMDRSEQKWVEVKSLDNQILFLGDNCTFSASASDFHGCKGNCIIFTDHFVYLTGDEDNALKSRGVCVFDLESGSIGSLANYPCYSKLFWPPPNWVSSTMLEVGLNELGI